VREGVNDLKSFDFDQISPNVSYIIEFCVQIEEVKGRIRLESCEGAKERREGRAGQYSYTFLVLEQMLLTIHSRIHYQLHSQHVQQRKVPLDIQKSVSLHLVSRHRQVLGLGKRFSGKHLVRMAILSEWQFFQLE